MEVVQAKTHAVGTNHIMDAFFGGLDSMTTLKKKVDQKDSEVSYKSPF
jgi:hypothetical protein